MVDLAAYFKGKRIYVDMMIEQTNTSSKYIH